MTNKIHIEDINEIGAFFIDASGRESIHLNLTKAEELIKCVAYFYFNGQDVKLTVDNINEQCFNVVRSKIHAAALAKLKTLKESNQ